MARPLKPARDSRPDVTFLLQNSLAWWALILGGWTLLSIFFAPEVYLYFLYKREPIPWSQAIQLTVTNGAIAAAFTPAIVWLTRRFRFERGKWPRSVLIHVFACLVFSVSHSWLYALLCYASPALSEALYMRFHPNLITYWAIVGFTEAIDYFQKYKDRERQLVLAELELLRVQLHPHFLFNTLHTISAMMHEDVKGADRIVTRLSDLLRMTLESIGKQEVPLKQEIEFLQGYIEIERTRFRDRLALALDVEPETLDALVPSMLLQPLAENSIRHGLGTQKKGGVITLQTRRRGDLLLLKVMDDGCGLTHDGRHPRREGLGLRVTRERLERLYPSDHRFDLANASSPCGAVATIAVPFHTAARKESTVPELLPDEDTGSDHRRRAVGAEAHRYPAQG